MVTFVVLQYSYFTSSNIYTRRFKIPMEEFNCINFLKSFYYKQGRFNRYKFLSISLYFDDDTVITSTTRYFHSWKNDFSFGRVLDVA